MALKSCHFACRTKPTTISLALKVAMTASRSFFRRFGYGPIVSSSTPRGIDLFLCECSFFHEQPGMHVNYQILQSNLAVCAASSSSSPTWAKTCYRVENEISAVVADDGMVIEL